MSRFRKDRIMIRHPKPIVTLAAFALALALVQSSEAQQGGRRGFGRGFTVSQPQLTSLEQVQTELKLTAEQKAKASEIDEQLRNKRRELFQGGNQDNFAERREQLAKATSEATEQLRAALDETQQNRLREIWIQVNGTAVLSDEALAKELKVTEQQQEQMSDARRESFEAAFQNAGDLSDDERRERFREARDEGEKKALAVLSAEQREQFEKLQGKKIEIDTSPLLQRRRDT
jgi:hypothetical protein